MKIKEICEKTGLTDRTVRYYIEEQLIFPFYTENYLGRRSFDFSEQDLERLKNIATLRAFGFSVEEIKELSLGGANNQQIVEEVKNRTKESLGENNRRLNILSNLELSKDIELSNLAQMLCESDVAIKNETARPDAKKRFISLIGSSMIFFAVWFPIILTIAVLVYKFCTLDMPIVHPVYLVYTLLCFLPSMITLLILQKIKGVKKVFRVILVMLCILCIPLGMLFSSKSVITCDHNYQTYRQVSPATCNSEGETVMKCDECGWFETRKIKKLAHVAVTIEGVEPTCVKKGISDGSYCSVCNTVLITQEELSPTQVHIPAWDAGIPATCTKQGLSAGSHCSVCKKILVKQDEVPAKGHSYEVDYVKQSCGSDGYTIYKCYCGESYRTNVARATNKHNFQLKGNSTGYICHTCGLEVIAYGNVDGSTSNSEDNVKYYVTGPAGNSPGRTLVIYGNGGIPEIDTAYGPPWLKYVYQIKTIIIEDGITSVEHGAFSDLGHENVQEFIIRSKEFQYDSYHFNFDPRFSGISTVKCRIIYDY